MDRYGINALKDGVDIETTYILDNADASGLEPSESCRDYGYELCCQNPYGMALCHFEMKNMADTIIHYDLVTYADKDTELLQAEKVDATSDEILGEIITDGMTDLQKARAIYDYVKKTAKYDRNAEKLIGREDWRETADRWGPAASAYGCLINGKCVCEGYSRAFTLLARKAGLITVIVYGKSWTTNHQWNRIWCYDEEDGSYTAYDVDCNLKIFTKNFSVLKLRTVKRYTDISSVNSLVSEDLSGRKAKYSFVFSGSKQGEYIVN